MRSTNRFSEDIDLLVDTRGCTNTQNNRQLENATKRYLCLPRDREQGKTNRSEVISVYTYDPVTGYDADDSLQRFGKLKIEATSFTISEPVTSLVVTPMLYDLATDEQKRILVAKYDVKPFEILTITIERIFIDKLFASEAYVRQSDDPHRAFEAAKHIYDLAVLKSHPQITALLCDTTQMERLLRIRMTEELERRDGIPGVPPRDFRFFTEAAGNAKVKAAYETMQRQYVLRDSDRIEYGAAMEVLVDIQAELEKNTAWLECRLPEKLKFRETHER